MHPVPQSQPASLSVTMPQRPISPRRANKMSPACNACRIKRAFEELVGHGDDGFEPVVLDDPAANLAFAGAGLAGEERRAVEDDGQPAAALVGGLHFRQHVLQEQEGAVVDARQAGAEAFGEALLLVLLANLLFLRLPFDAEGRV